LPTTPSPKRHPYDQWSPDARALDLVGDKWTLLIIRDLSPGPRRFVELQRVLPGISTEQLRSRLNRMVADGLLTRQRYREVPPRVDYELTTRAKELLPVLGALGRWGYDWAWTAPRDAEAIDIGAILRIAPGLVQPPAGVSGAGIARWISSTSTRPAARTMAPGSSGSRASARGSAITSAPAFPSTSASAGPMKSSDWVSNTRLPSSRVEIIAVSARGISIVSRAGVLHEADR